MGQQQFYNPLTETAQQKTNRRSHVWGVIGQLRPDISVEAAQRDLETIAARLATAYPQSNGGRGIEVSPLVEELTGNVRRGLSWLVTIGLWFVATVIVLLMAYYIASQMIL